MSERRSRRPSTKRAVLARVFEICQKRGDYVFHNDLVGEVSQEMGFRNKFDATKIDHSSEYPENMQQGKGWFLVHLGKGYHQFIYDQSLAFHRFEEIDDIESVVWKYVPSVLNDFDTSEANILSIAYNQLILHDFLYGDRRANPQVYLPRRTSETGDYTINSVPVRVRHMQMEMDLVLEWRGDVTIFEAKNKFHPDFATYQLFNPYLYFDRNRQSGKLNIGNIHCCFLQRNKQGQTSILRFHLYRFHNREMASIELIRKKEYILHETEPL